MGKSKKRAGIITASVLAAGLAIGGVTTGVLLANRPLDITYYANNGTPAVTTQVNKNETLNLPTPTREGYNFAGWYLDTALTKQVTAKTKLKNNSKLYAGWELTDGTVLTSTSVNGEATVQAETQGLKSIGAYAFANSKITSITIPNTVTTIGEGAFANCANLTNVKLGSKLETISASAFSGSNISGSFVIPNSVKTIGSNAFSNNKNLRSITIGTGVTSIGSAAFNGCSVLTSVAFNATNCKIANNSCIFKNAGSASGFSVTFGDNMAIPDYVMQGANYLKSVSFGSNINLIGNSSFYDCISLTNITIPSTVSVISNYAFYNTGITSITTSTSTTSIGDYAFAYCTKLESATICGSTGSLIGNFAFSYQSKLTNVIIDGISQLGNNVFSYNTVLNSVYISNSVIKMAINPSTSSPFAYISSSFKIYCAPASKPSGWSSYWSGNCDPQIIWGGTFAEMDWATIKIWSDAGYANRLFSVGDEKHVAIDAYRGFYLTYQIADFNHDVNSDGKTIGITIITKNLLNQALSRNDANAWLVEEHLSSIVPYDYITPAKKNTNIGSQIVSENKKVFLLSYFEVQANTSGSTNPEGFQYAIFKSSNLIKMPYTQPSTPYSWWLRTIIPYTNNAFCVDKSGTITTISGSEECNVCFGFCI